MTFLLWKSSIWWNKAEIFIIQSYDYLENKLFPFWVSNSIHSQLLHITLHTKKQNVIYFLKIM